MTSTTVRPASGRIRTPGATEGMVRVLWRQHRTALLWLAVATGALAVFLAVAGALDHANYATLTADHCQVSNRFGVVNLNTGQACRAAGRAFPWLVGTYTGPGLRYQLYQYVAPLLVLVVFAAAGALVGAPLLAREYETGTFRFAWTQSTGRMRWCAVQIALLAAVLLAMAAGLGALSAWSLGPFDALGQVSRWQAVQFETGPATAAGWAVLAFLTGTLAGAALRRIVPAVAATAVTLGAVVTVTFAKLNSLLLGFRPLTARDDAAAPVLGIESITVHHVTWIGRTPMLTATGPNIPGPPGALQLSGWYTGPDGHQPAGAAANRLISSWDHTKNVDSLPAWLAQHHYALWVSYQPGDRYWPLQLTAGAILLLVALLFGAATLWLVKSRRALDTAGAGSSAPPRRSER